MRIRLILSVVFSCFVVEGSAPTIAVGQVTSQLILSTPSCKGCRIKLEPVVRLGGPTEKDGMLGRDPMLARDSQGRYFVAPGVNPGEILVFDKTGRLLRSIGRKGSGPGEFGDIRRLWIGPGDSLHIFDYERYTVMSPDFKYVRAYPTGYLPWDAKFLPTGSTIQAFASGQSSAFGYPLHLVEPNGKLRKSFGIEVPSTNSRFVASRMRAIAPSRRGGYWSAFQTEYRIDRWDTLGTLAQTLKRDVPWFKSWTGTLTAGTYMFAVREDEQGYVWTLIVRGDGSGGVIEVLDPDAGALVAREELSFIVMRFAGDLVWRLTEDAAGEPFLQVMRTVLVKP